MGKSEKHATRADDWRVYGENLATETHYAGAPFLDARRLMLAAWEGWTSGDPPSGVIAYEFLATLWAMAMSSGLDELGPVIEKAGAEIERLIKPTPSDEG